ncbi:outer membrane protein assembly factor BamE domain-containing protein [Pyxidicoccus trucidator]|uniref:outer membrane protein assembly factor BamE domain-containing protein n=1 Tax=Pyxidicoccus trucidator TaxID=2709662 RepID=UPI0013D9141A|nr:outer membrane protein assembly factor BamE [Pyxidicoccus trucidator]
MRTREHCLLAVLLMALGGSSCSECHFLGYPEATTFAAGYSEEAFAKVEAGMSREEVTKLLGQPLGIVTWDNGRETWEYSKATHGGGYQQRNIVFSEQGEVRSKAASLADD